MTKITYIVKTHKSPRISTYLFRYIGEKELKNLQRTGWLKAQGSGVFRGIPFTSSLGSQFAISSYPGLYIIRIKYRDFMSKILPVFYVSMGISRHSYEQILQFYGPLVSHPTFAFENLKNINGDGFIQHSYFSKENEWRAWDDLFVGNHWSIVRRH